MTKSFSAMLLFGLMVSFELSSAQLIEKGLVVTKGRQGVSTRISGTLQGVAKTGTVVKEGDFLFEVGTNDREDRKDEKYEEIQGLKRDIDDKKRAILEKEEIFDYYSKYLKAKVEYQELAYVLKSRPLPKAEERIETIPIEITQLKLEAAKEERDRQKRLIEAGFAAPTSITSKELRLKSLELQLLKDRHSLKLSKEGASEEEELELKVKWDTAKEELARQKKEHDHEVMVLESQLKELETQLGHELIQYKVMVDNIAHGVMHAEKAGIWVLKRYRDWWQGGVWRDMNIGKRVNEYQVVGELLDPKVLNIEVLLHEADRSRVKIGQVCTLTLPALENAKVKGKVSSISDIAKDRLDLAPSGEETEHSRYGLFQVFIEPEKRLEDLKPGMSAIVHFELLKEGAK